MILHVPLPPPTPYLLYNPAARKPSRVEANVATESTTATNTVTVGAVATVTAATTVPVPVTYSQVGSGTKCTYNEYTDFIQVDNRLVFLQPSLPTSVLASSCTFSADCHDWPLSSPDNNYRAGILECEAICTARSYCKFFFYIRSDPAYRNQGDTSAYCIIGTCRALPIRPLPLPLPLGLLIVGIGRDCRGASCVGHAQRLNLSLWPQSARAAARC